MPLTAILDLRLKPEAVADAPAVINETLKATRAFDGCVRVDVLIDVADPTHVVLFEIWDSPEADAAYRAFRATPEGKSNLGTLLAGPPTTSKFEVAADI
jgi:quinol monooxygenase YgiN